MGGRGKLVQSVGEKEASPICGAGGNSEILAVHLYFRLF